MKITTDSILKDAFEFEDKTIPFTVHLTKSAQGVYKKRAEITQIGAYAEDPEALGRSIVELYTLIFGADVTQELLDYYADDALALLTDTMPVITETIFPAYDRLAKKAREKQFRLKRG